MMTKSKIHIFHSALSGIIIAAVLISCIPSVFADANTITIASLNDFIAFSELCTLDTASRGKTVNLECDIDFSSTDFSPVPTFGGRFNGNGYTVSGVKFERDGSHIGLFRYVREGAVISSLNVKGDITPGGTKSHVGGIAGDNSGTIENCTFEGNIKGENLIGGIVGLNRETGRIISSSGYGSIIGENSTGGIAGKNEGLIQDCTNSTDINTSYEEKKKDLSEMDIETDAPLENYKTEKEENEEESVLGHTDTGGITGYNSGIIKGCMNNASVGYQHVGYNVGGIAGRQSGYILGCVNNGFVQGRKDVGGISGQAEPYLLLQTSENSMQNIRDELDKLHTMVDRLISDMDNLGDESQKDFNSIIDQTENAKSSAKSLMDRGTDFVDDNLSEINAQAAILSNTLDKLTPAFEALEDAGGGTADAISEIGDALDKINFYTPDLIDEIDQICDALNTMSRAENSIKRAATRARWAIDDLSNAITFDDAVAVRKAADTLANAISDIVKAREDIQKSVTSISEIIKSKPDSFASLGLNVKEISAELESIANNIKITFEALKTVRSSLNTMAKNTEISFSSFRSAASDMDDAVTSLENAMGYISKGMTQISSALRSAADKLDEYTDDVSGQLNNAKDDLSKAADNLSYSVEDICSAIDTIKQIIIDLSNEEVLSFVKLGDGFKQDSQNLFDSLTDISSSIRSLKTTLSNNGDNLSADITKISSTFNSIMNMLTGAAEDMTGNEITDIFVDVSEENIENTKQGKIDGCLNSGNVEADRNAGGIVGSMAIEYAKDPEDEVEKPDGLNFTYLTKAILQECVNDGNVKGKKDCTGGIVGLSELGTVYECENYGSSESTNGNYVGGIAGKSESSIRKSYSKSSVTGKRYIGGIAGKATDMSASYSIVNVSGNEYTGAVCGEAENTNKLRGNRFINNGLGAADGISYSGSAEPITFEELVNIPNIPKRFISFTVTFIADGTVIATQDMEYGESVDRIKYPDIPEKEGMFGAWPPVDSNIITENLEITCEYKPYITILSSEERNENGKLAIALAEGNFTDSARLHAFSGTALPPSDAHGNVKVYDIKLNNTDIQGSDCVNIRILNENRDKVKAWIYTDESWEKTDVESRGKYVIIKTTGTQNTVCLQYTKSNSGIMLIIFIAIAAVPVLLLVLFKKKKVKKTVDKPEA